MKHFKLSFLWLASCLSLTSLSYAGIAEADFKEAERIFNAAYGDEDEVFRSFELYQKAAEAGHVGAQEMAGFILLNQGGPQDEQGAFQWFLKAAKGGSVDAQVMVASLALKGFMGMAPDISLAYYYFKKAAQAGDSEAQYMLGLGHLQGKGVEKSEEKAKFYLEKAALQGVAGAARKLGDIYWDLAQDKTALDWYEKAVEYGDAEANYYLALGLKKQGGDAKRVYEYFYIAALNGYVPAIHEVGMCYKQGEGVEKDEATAESFLMDAKDAGYKAEE